MNIDPLKLITALYQDSSHIKQTKDSPVITISQLEEASFFASQFRVRKAEEVASFLWNTFYKEQKKQYRRKMRKVSKKETSVQVILHKRQHEPQDQEERFCSYITGYLS